MPTKTGTEIVQNEKGRGGRAEHLMNTKNNKRTIACSFLLSALVLLSGCTGIGPKTIPRDRFDYAAAVSDSWKDQMLLNIVKIRYADAPVFLDIASVINSYSLQSDLSLGGSLQSPLTPVAGNANTLALGAAGRYTDSPTITYNPLIGEKFNKSLMKPIPPNAIFSFIQNGWPADFLLRGCVQAVNGMYNRVGVGHDSHPADPEFIQLVEAIVRVQKSGSLGIRMERDKSGDAAVLYFRKRNTERSAADIVELQRLLGLDSSSSEFKVVYGMMPREKNEIAVLSRSMLEIMLELSSSIEVPAIHAAENRVFPALADQESVGSPKQLIRVRSDVNRPQDAFVTVRYRDNWFWIDDRDLYSKRTFSFLMFLFTLTETGGAPAVPVVTVPTR
jgi:hypothetical protein